MNSFFKKKLFRNIILTLVVTFLVLAPTITNAQTTAPGNTEDGGFWSTLGHFASYAIPGYGNVVMMQDIATALVEPILKILLAWLGQLALSLSALILWISGTLMEAVMKYTVVDMSTNVGGISTLNLAWETFRDLSNMLFIFIILYIAIASILNLSGINVKKMLVNVVVVALLINFSLFFTKIIIDASNIVTIGFYNQIIGPAANGLGIAGAFVQKMLLTGLISPQFAVNPTSVLSSTQTLGEIFLGGLLGSVFLLVAAVVFFAFSIMFIGRFVTLIFLMILSPIAFVSMALPTDKYSKMWWNKLIDQCIFAPVCMALIWVSLTVLSGVLAPTESAANSTNGVANASVWTSLFTPGAAGAPPAPENIHIIMNFIIVISMLIFSLVVGKQMGAYGAGKALNFLEKTGARVRGFAVGSVKTTGGAIAATTVGRAGRWADDKLKKTWVGNSRAGRVVREVTTEKIAGSKFGGKITFDDWKKTGKDIALKDRERETDNILRQGIMTGIVTATPGGPALTPVQIANNTRIEEHNRRFRERINNMSTKELDAMGTSDLVRHVEHFNTRQIEHILEKSDKPEADKERIRTARFAPMDAVVNTLREEEDQINIANTTLTGAARTARIENVRREPRFVAARDRVSAMSTREIEMSGTRFTQHGPFIRSISKDKFDTISKPDNVNYTLPQKQQMTDDRNALFNATLNRASTSTPVGTPLSTAVDNYEQVREAVTNMNSKERGQLGVAVLTNPGVLPIYTPAMLQKMKGDLSDAKQDAIRIAIVNEATAIMNTPVGTAHTPAEERILDTAIWLMGPGLSEF